MAGGGGERVTQTQSIPEWLEEPVRANIAEADRIAARPYEAYGGATVAGYNPAQRQAYGLAQSSVGATSPYISSASGMMQSAADYQPQQVGASGIGYDAVTAPNFLQGDVQKYMNPYTQNVIDASMLDLKSANDLALQQINQQASGARAFGGSRQGVAEALQRSQAAQGAGRMSADLRNQSYNQAVAAMQADQGRQMQASLANQQAGMTAGAANQNAQMQAALANQQAGIGASGQRLTAANSLAGLGAQAQAANQADILQLTQAGMLQQQQTQSSLDDAYRRWAEERNYPLEGLNMRIGATSSAPVPMSSTQTSKSSFNPMSLIGPAIGLAGMFAGSDERMKTDISRLPEPDEETGLPLYAYRYKGDPKTYPKVVGPMAQDIQEEYPDEVKKIGGRLAVNLGFGPMQRTFG